MPFGAAQRKAAMTVEQLARALGAELMLPSQWPTEGVRAEKAPAEAAMADAVQRLRPIDHVTGLTGARGSSLVFVEQASMLAVALTSGAGAILLPPSLVPALPARNDQPGATLLLAEQPRLAFARAGQLLAPVQAPRGIHSTASIAPGATVGLRTSIGPYVVIEAGVTIGAGSEIEAGVFIGAGATVGVDCHLYPRAVLYAGTRLGDRVVVHAGAVLGADGFGFVRDQATGEYVPFPQQGTLVIEDDVEIGANTTIDRGALAETRIARGVKIDNLVHVGHNVQVGENVVIAAQTGISGSSTIGRGAVLGGQVGIGDHSGVGEGVLLGGQAGVLPHKTLRGPGQLFWGTPAKPVKQYLRELASLTRLTRPARRGPVAEGE
jgi:UDP-3-O-[3-hydroxymyristoyl] glucosamine N-acyltransferase